MKLSTSFQRFLAASLLLLVSSQQAWAEFTCDIDFSYGLVVNPEQIRVMDKSRTIMQINGSEQLFIGGRWQSLDKQQRRWLQDYADGLHYVVPKMIVLATEGVDLAIKNIDHVYLGLVGSDHESYERLRKAMERVKIRVKDKFRHASNHYFIGPGSLESVDEFVDTEIETQLEEAFSTSVGGILSAISGVNTNSSDNSDSDADALTRQLESMEEKIETDVRPRAYTLKNKAQWFCDKLKKLDDTEEKLRASLPAFEKYNIITSTQ